MVEPGHRNIGRCCSRPLAYLLTHLYLAERGADSCSWLDISSRPTFSAPDGTHETPGVTETTEHDSTVAPPFRRSGLTLLLGRASYQRCTSMWHGVSDLAMPIDSGQPRAHRRQMYRDLLACEAVRQPCLAAIVLPGPARRRADIPNVYTRL